MKKPSRTAVICVVAFVILAGVALLLWLVTAAAMPIVISGVLTLIAAVTAVNWIVSALLQRSIWRRSKVHTDHCLLEFRPRFAP